MSKPKKKRTKKYLPGRPKIPAWAYDAWGQLTEKDFEIFEDAVKIMVDQLIYLHDKTAPEDYDVESEVEFKIKRQLKRIAEEEDA